MTHCALLPEPLQEKPFLQQVVPQAVSPSPG